MNETDKAMEEVSNIAAGLFIALIFFIGALSGYGISQLVKVQKAEEEGYHAKLKFCHERMQDGKTRYIWRQEYCGKFKRLDAVDPVSGKPVMGVIEE